MASIASRALDAAQKTFVLCSLSAVAFHSYQIIYNCSIGVTKDKSNSTYYEDVQKAVEKDYATSYGKTDKRDWYDKDDQSYLKDVPRGIKPKGAN